MTHENTQTIIDLNGARGRAALERIAKGEATIGAQSKRTREDWREYGEALLAGRIEHASDKAFGTWVKEQGLDAPPANNAVVRSDAIWLAEHWAQVEEFYLNFEIKVGEHRPTNIRTACRDAGYRWAFASEENAKKAKARREETTVGWTVAADPYLSDAGRAWLGKRVHAPKKADIEDELGEQFPERVLPSRGEAIAAAVERCVLKIAPTRILNDIEVEKQALPETMRTRFDRLWARAQTALDAIFEQRVEEGIRIRVKERVSLKEEYLHQEQIKLNLERKDLQLRMKTLDQWMTQEEFNLVRGCLHPDRHPNEQEKYRKAFQIFNRLEQHLEPNAALRKDRGWS